MFTTFLVALRPCYRCRFVREKNIDSCHQAKKLMGSLDHANRMFDFDKLASVVSTVTRNLNKVIDINYYPVETARNSNMRHRPIGLGVQGLADTFILLGLPFDSDEAQKLNRWVVTQLSNMRCARPGAVMLPVALL